MGICRWDGKGRSLYTSLFGEEANPLQTCTLDGEQEERELAQWTLPPGMALGSLTSALSWLYPLRIKVCCLLPPFCVLSTRKDIRLFVYMESGKGV